MGSKAYLISCILVVTVLCLALANTVLSSQLSPKFYDQSCSDALPAIKRVVEAAVKKERRMAASLLRLHFHDCFVNGCDASILLDSTDTIDSEKNAGPNINSARGFDVVDQIKSEVDKCCGASVVSCSDILAVAARDSVVALGGPWWKVKLGRRDSTNASKDEAERNLPSPLMDLPQLIDNFKSHGLDDKDLVVLSGGHTLGFAQCNLFRTRLYNETSTIHKGFAKKLKSVCPESGGDSQLSPLDPTPAQFDNGYFSNLVKYKGLLHSDQQLFNGNGVSRSYTDDLVNTYSKSPDAFSYDFANSMIKMGDIKPLTGDEGEIRYNCWKVNH